jgi:integrase/recombinase XerD
MLELSVVGEESVVVHVLHSRVVGPLEAYAPGFAGELERLGYAVHAASHQVALIAHLSGWLAKRTMGTGDLAPAVIERYVQDRRAAGYRLFRSEKALTPLVDYLRGLGVTPDAEPVAARTPGEVLLERYRDYLIGERGMGVRSVRGYLDLVRPFIERHVRDGAGLRGLAAGDVTSFLVAESGRRSPKTVQRLASALRSLLRYWHVHDVIETPLVAAVPKVAYRSPGLPRGLQPGQVAALLDSCDRSQRAGLRDFAVLTLLSRVGLRAGEVAGLVLDDIDWRCGEITVVGKGYRRDRLPLPCDVGQAIAEYLQRGRPADALDRRVFVRIRAPHRGLAAGGVTQAVAAAARRAGLGTVYAHRLRHSAATAMLAAGASLAEIGQVLRHRRPLTTSVYAKVNTEALRSLARPWPTGGVS